MNTRKPKLYISRLRNPSDGSWSWDDEPRTMKETKRLATINRCMAGITTQVWPLDEALPLMQQDELAKAKGER